jgi:hypothetical protein
MMCAVMGATVVIESPKRDRFAGGVYANPGSQHVYGIFRGGGAGRGCRGGGPSYGTTTDDIAQEARRGF